MGRVGFVAVILILVWLRVVPRIHGIDLLALAGIHIGAVQAGDVVLVRPDGVGVFLAAFGPLNPVLAALIHGSSELLSILNSARLLPGTRASRV
jgi:hypothetical protein